MNNLPIELTTDIIQRVTQNDYKGLVNIAIVCKSFYEAVSHHLDEYKMVFEEPDAFSVWTKVIDGSEIMTAIVTATELHKEKLVMVDPLKDNKEYWFEQAETGKVIGEAELFPDWEDDAWREGVITSFYTYKVTHPLLKVGTNDDTFDSLPVDISAVMVEILCTDSWDTFCVPYWALSGVASYDA